MAKVAYPATCCGTLIREYFYSDKKISFSEHIARQSQDQKEFFSWLFQEKLDDKSYSELTMHHQVAFDNFLKYCEKRYEKFIQNRIKKGFPCVTAE